MNGLLDRDPNEGGELIEDPNEAPKGDECDALAIGCDDCEGPPPDSEPKGNVGDMEKVDPPRLNDG